MAPQPSIGGQMSICGHEVAVLDGIAPCRSAPVRNFSDFELHYQPIVDLRDGSAVAAEALARRRDADGCIVPPMDFLPEFEALGSMHVFDRWALASALTEFDLVTDLVTGCADARLNVNISAQYLLDPVGLLSDIDNALELTGFPPTQLVLELSERGPLERAQVIALTFALRVRGVQVSLDDFGVNRSGLAVLDQIHVDEVKLDGRFAMGIFANVTDGRIVRAVRQLCDDMGVRLVVEGIESADARCALLDSGIVYGQGYHFARPTRPF
jgi:EAL domain-containing protein (putative c-di-GMP-specific phosphodiesterase class I)